MYKVISSTYIDKNEVLYDLSKVSKTTLELIAPLFDYIKADMVAKALPILDKKDFVYYINGAMASLAILHKYISEWAKAIKDEHISLITRQPIVKKPWQNKRKIT